jgi:hypothetical protein
MPFTTIATSSPLPAAAPGSNYVDISIASLTAAQANASSPVIAANSERRVLMINPPADCVLRISAGAGRGWPLYGNVPNSISGEECPTNALYVTGLATGVALTIWEAQS